jgi:hypothetical protein
MASESADLARIAEERRPVSFLARPLLQKPPQHRTPARVAQLA